jgi:hypothetical protein
MRQATLLRELNCYEKADTSLDPLGRLPAGSYEVIRARPNYPDPNTDFVLLSVPDLPSKRAWICSRWMKRTYAVVREMREAEGPEPIPESALVRLLPEFRGYGYDLHRPRYPYSLPGIPDSLLEPPAANNCCTFVEALLVKAWRDVRGSAFRWTRTRHNQMMITDITDPFSPITCVVQAGMGAAVRSPDLLPEPWTIAQAWRRGPDGGGWSGGHTFLVLDTDLDTQRVLTLESNDYYGMDGPGFRGLGDLDDFPGQHPGARWRDRGGLWTWSHFRQVYPYMKLAKLAVSDVRWIAEG